MPTHALYLLKTNRGHRMSGDPINLFPVLIAGGSGTRLWPISRELFPKQLVSFFGQDSLIQNTIKRLLPVFESDKIRVVCGKEHALATVRDIEAMNLPAKGKIIAEPCGRNTAPAILLSLLEILKTETDALIFVFPADHLIKNVSIFHEKIYIAAEMARQDAIVTFGITPKYPETGYGYIEASGTRVGQGFRIGRFVEKPDYPTAKKYLKAGNFFWNSGMFAFKASVMLGEFAAFCPGMLQQVREIVSGEKELNIENYSRIESISIDYAIMEKTKKAAVLPSDFGWSDIGSWKSLYDFMPKDADGNAVASGDVILQNTRGSLIMGGDRLITVNHLEDVVVVETPDAVFVSDMENSRDVKTIVSDLKQKDRKEYRIHITVHEPWGHYRVLESSHHLTIKHLVLFRRSCIPRQTLSGKIRQWTVIEGTASVRYDSTHKVLKEYQGITIPENRVHSVENAGENELHLIEVEKSV